MRAVTIERMSKARDIVTDSVWGSSKMRFLDWSVGETVVVLVAREGVLTARVSGPRFKSDRLAWESDASDWHVPLADVTLVKDAGGQRLNTDIRDALKRCYGEQVYFRLLLSGMKLGHEPERLVLELLQRPAGTE
jgi:hypothetical protein